MLEMVNFSTYKKENDTLDLENDWRRDFLKLRVDE